MADARPKPAPEWATGLLVLADGSAIWGRGFGAEGEAVGEICFNTAMTGYQEIMTDPSYAAQIVTFTFPHIGNVGANYEDLEADNPYALGCVVRDDVTSPSNFRSSQNFVLWRVGGAAQLDVAILERRLDQADRVAPGGVAGLHGAGQRRFDRVANHGSRCRLRGTASLTGRFVF